MIRDVIEKDAEDIVSIYNHYIGNSVATFEENKVEVSDILTRIRKVKDSGHSWLVATESESVIGYAYSTKWNERAAYRKTAEVSIYLSNTCIKKGIGTELYKSLFSCLRKNDVHIAIGGITLPNTASIALHEKFGMVQVAHFREVGYKFGQWLDVGYWQVNLDA